MCCLTELRLGLFIKLRDGLRRHFSGLPPCVRFPQSLVCAALTTLLFTLVGRSTAAPRAAGEASAKPNIIVILTDDQGYADLSIQGQVTDIKTPHIDPVAKSGVRCTAGYITAPQCSPSRAGLIPGRYQQRFGLDPDPRLPAAAGGSHRRRATARRWLCLRYGWQMAPRPESHLYPVDQEVPA